MSQQIRPVVNVFYFVADLQAWLSASSAGE
jgi:hypothetical protein